MYNVFQLSIKYFSYCLKSFLSINKNNSNTFSKNFKLEILHRKNNNKRIDEVEKIRQELLQDNNIIEVQDFGAGSKTNKTKFRKINAIAKSSLKPKKYSDLISKIVCYNNYKNCLELGTCLGITSSYIATSNSNVQLVTMEGATAIATKAKEVFKKLNCNNIKIVEGNFDNTLEATLQNFDAIDFAFIDGNHQYTPTINYTNAIIKKIAYKGMIILDDIYWSKEMTKAWNEIKNYSNVSASIDLFYIGILLFDKEVTTKQDYVIWY